MEQARSEETPRAYWFVGASYGGTEDQLPRFLEDGIWENGYKDRYLDLVRSMQPGDRIAIKAAYTRKHNLPFDNRGQTVSVMAIKAIGTITENLDDGRRVRVDWTKVEPIREWYFYTHRGTIWRLQSDNWMSRGLVEFAFEGKPQDIDRFRNEPYWKERYGDQDPKARRFAWAPFYEAIATKLLDYRDERAPLIEKVQDLAGRVEGLGYLTEDTYKDGSTGFVRDICPFTVMGMFNRGVTEENRKIIAAELARLLEVDEAVPQSFEGIPILNNLRSWFFPRENMRDPDHIDGLWAVFSAGVTFSESGDEETRDAFLRAFDAINGRRGVAWNLTFGLYWARPWSFPSLDKNSQLYLNKKLGVPIARHGPKKRCSGADYLALMDTLETRFQEASYPVHSYPELSREAWLYKSPTAEDDSSEPEDKLGEAEDEDGAEGLGGHAPIISYSIDDILREGCFLAQAELERLLGRLKTKKNVILQGPPGTGKTWLAKRLAFALMGEKNESRVRAVQFHPNLSYEDFVRGWRPTGDGKLSLVDGVFMEAIKAAAKAPGSRFVVVIEEINRGNPAQIFGELLTLLEAGKRTPSEALELCYPDADGKRRPVHIPENLYVIGTMNIADRSLALVDLALRRRFAFVDLEPRLNGVWRDWVVNARGVDADRVGEIERRIRELNEHIAGDPRLGRQFRIGHSYVTPTESLEPDATGDWFTQVVETEIGPLLEEYWFDAPDEAAKARERLTQGW